MSSVPILQFLFDIGDTRINDTWLEDQLNCIPWNGLDKATPLHHAVRVGNIDSVRSIEEEQTDHRGRITYSKITACT